MSSGSDSCQEEEVEKKDTSSDVRYSSKSRRSQARNITSTQPNVYTPLTATARCTESQQITSTVEANKRESVLLSASNAKKCNAGKLKGNNSSRCSSVKNQRSSVRPFFCCGSELSLVSLVEGMDLKDESHLHHSKKLQSIECYSSSDEESFELSPFRKRCNTVNAGETSRHSTIRRKKKDKHIKKKKFWSLRLHSRWSPRWRSRRSQRSKCSRELSQQSISSGCSNSNNAVATSAFNGQSPTLRSISSHSSQSQFMGLFNFFHAEEIAEVARQRRTEEMALGIELRAQAISSALRSNVDMSGSMMDILRFRSRLSSTNSDILQTSDPPIEDLMNNLFSQVQNSRGSVDSWRGLGPQIHTQIDYVHYLVPDLAKITSCSYYWGVMDRYEAERLLDNKPPGTFLLRDSAQEDFLFSVSFRRYNRSLHARIEQWNHRFSFDAHDPNVFSASTVCELVEHYKDPSLCMFFEPMLTQPLHRTFPFSLQHMSRTVICDKIAYDDIQVLPIPNSFKKFLQTYHYKQKIRVRRFDNPDMASADSRVVS